MERSIMRDFQCWVMVVVVAAAVRQRATLYWTKAILMLEKQWRETKNGGSKQW